MSEANKKTVEDEILDVYNEISDFSLSSRQYFKELANINKKEENKEIIAEITANIAKCFLNIFGCGIGGAIFEGANGIIDAFKKDKNEIQKLSEAYDHIVKKHNNYYKNLKVKTGKGLRRINVYDYDEQNGYYYEVKNPKVKIKKLETTEEKLNKIYDKYGIGGKTIKGRIERKKISDTVVAYHNNLNRVNINKRLNKHDKQINVLEEINKQQNKDLEELRKDLENFKKEKERQNEQIQMLQAMLKELQSRGNISQTQLTSQRTNSVATQTPQKEDKEVHAQNLSDRFKGLEMIEISEAKDAEEEQIRTPLATGTSNEEAAKSQVVENGAEEDSEIRDNGISDTEDTKEEDKEAKIKQFQDLPNRLKNVERLKLPEINNKEKNRIQAQLTSQSLDSGIAYLQDKNKRVRGANKEMDGRKSELSSMSIPC